MSSETLERIDAELQRLSLAEQVRLMERLAQVIQAKVVHQEQFMESELAAMAVDPDIQREISEIQSEFAATESDGLAEDR